MNPWKWRPKNIIIMYHCNKCCNIIIYERPCTKYRDREDAESSLFDKLLYCDNTFFLWTIYLILRHREVKKKKSLLFLSALFFKFSDLFRYAAVVYTRWINTLRENKIVFFSSVFLDQFFVVRNLYFWCSDNNQQQRRDDGCRSRVLEDFTPPEGGGKFDNN